VQEDYMIQPDGRASLDVRERYLRKQRRARGLGDRGVIALWVGISALASWVFIVALAGLSR
jgi:hypothetical protein